MNIGRKQSLYEVWKAVDFRGNLNEAWEAQISRRAVGKVLMTIIMIIMIIVMITLILLLLLLIIKCKGN